MPKKKKQTPQERRAQEKQRRIEAAGKPKEERRTLPPKKKKAPKPAAAPAESAAPANDPPEPAAQDAPMRSPAPALKRHAATKFRTLEFGEGEYAGADCSRYDIRYPARMDIQALFNAIRKERKDEHGTVYISTNLAEAGPANYQLSYEYAGGMFTRRETPSRDRRAPLLADLLDKPIRKLRACGGWGTMDYFVNIHDLPAEPDTENA